MPIGKTVKKAKPKLDSLGVTAWQEAINKLAGGVPVDEPMILTGGNKLGKSKTTEEWSEDIKKAMDQDPHNPSETLITLDSLGPFTDEELKAAHEQHVSEQNLLAKLKHTSIKPSGPALSVLTGAVPGIIPYTYQKPIDVDFSELEDKLLTLMNSQNKFNDDLLLYGSATTMAKPFLDKLTKEEIDKAIKKLSDFKKQNPDYYNKIFVSELIPLPSKETGGEFFMKGYPHFTTLNAYGNFDFRVAVRAEHLDGLLTPVNYLLNHIRGKLKNSVVISGYERAVVLELLDNVHGKDDYAKIKRTLLAFFDPDYQSQKNAHMERAFSVGDTTRVRMVIDRTSDGIIMLTLEVRGEDTAF